MIEGLSSDAQHTTTMQRSNPEEFQEQSYAESHTRQIVNEHGGELFGYTLQNNVQLA